VSSPNLATPPDPPQTVTSGERRGRTPQHEHADLRLRTTWQRHLGAGIRPVSHESCAYCGPAHGQRWTVTEPQPPAWVELPVGASSAPYRLVGQPGTGRPARDQLGNYLYVPIVGDQT
jgi:hypothetical protein